MHNIQLRWKKSNGQYSNQSILNIYGDKVILQYREILNPLEIGLHEPIWSDWTDVPFIKDNDPL